jgi:serine/threonine-protein kinase HipA
MNLDGVPIQGDKVGFYFDNLLPDSEPIRQRIRKRFHTKSGDTFDLLEAIGRDCVGAVQLLPDGQVPEGITAIAATPLTDDELEQELLGAISLPSITTSASDDFRISIAGAQEKTAFLWHKGHWCKPRNATPTTHIFKLPLGLVGGRQMDMTLSLENEWLSTQLLAAYGLPVATSQLAQFGNTRTLVVSRFDRRLHSSKRYWLRLPQEDLCQATGTPGPLKYESEGGPELLEIAQVLKGSLAREQDLTTLLSAQLLFWMLAATDGHAKNFSLHLLSEGRYRLTPLYDVLSMWPIAGNRQNQVHPTKLSLAMALRGKHKHYRLHEITRRHFNHTAQRCGLGRDMEGIIADTLAKTPAVIERVGGNLPAGFPERLFDSITKGLRKSAERLESMPSE